MRIKSYGLFFDYEPTKELENEVLPVTKEYVLQQLNNFVLVNYFKSEKKNIAVNEDGFQNIHTQMYIELYMTDINPRKILYDRKDDKLYRILEMPINQVFDPSKRKLYTLPIDFINENDLRFDMNFIRNKYNQLWGALNGTL